MGPVSFSELHHELRNWSEGITDVSGLASVQGDGEQVLISFEKAIAPVQTVGEFFLFASRYVWHVRID